jgi:DNA-binding NarL/FixJ family response regulator
MKRHNIGVLCVEDHPIVAEGIASIVNKQPDMAVVGIATSIKEAVDSFRRERPDITLMDLELRAGDNGIEAIRQIRRDTPDARIIVLTVHQGDEDIFQALNAGAAAYLLKEEVPDELIRTIRSVENGTAPPMRPALVERLAKCTSGQHLTPREVQVLSLVSHGLRNKEIAAVLGISEETARVHVKNILTKLEVNDRSGAVAEGARRGIIRIS